MKFAMLYILLSAVLIYAAGFWFHLVAILFWKGWCLL